MLPMVLKVALIAFLVIGVSVLLVTFIRNSRKKGFPTPQSSSQFWQVKGATPPTPKPSWAERDPDDDAPPQV